MAAGRGIKTERGKQTINTCSLCSAECSALFWWPRNKSTKSFSADGLNCAGDPLAVHFLSGLISSGDLSSELFEERPFE